MRRLSSDAGPRRVTLCMKPRTMEILLCHRASYFARAGQAPQRSKRLVEAAVAALRSRDASKQQRAVDAILRDARARVPRLHWAADWVGAGALQVCTVESARIQRR